MGGALRVLIAATCIAVLAAVGYWFWQQYEAAQIAQRMAELQKERKLCLIWVETQLAGHGNDSTKFLAEDCVKRGLVTGDDIAHLKRR